MIDVFSLYHYVCSCTAFGVRCGWGEYCKVDAFSFLCLSSSQRRSYFEYILVPIGFKQASSFAF